MARQRAKSHGTTIHFQMHFWVADTVDDEGRLLSRWTAGVPSQTPISDVQVSIRRGAETVWTAPRRATSWLSIQDGLASLETDVQHTLVLEPDPDQLSPGPCGPHTGRRHDDVPAGRARFDMQFRPLEIDFRVEAVALADGSTVTIRDVAARHDTAGDRGPHGHARLARHGSGFAKLEIDWKPDWLRRIRTTKEGRLVEKLSPHPIALHTDSGVPDMIVLHRTGGESIGNALNTVLSPSTDEGGYHYLADRDGHIVKLLHESRGGWHTETSFWHPLAGPGRTAMRMSPTNTISRFSIGIEHVDGNRDYPDAQIRASLDLVKRLVNHFGIHPQLVVGHADIRCLEGANPRLHGSARPWDPSYEFPWPRYEADGSALAPDFETDEFPGMYGGVFEKYPDILLKPGDEDASRRFGGKTRSDVTGTPVRELQQDLATVGYALGLGRTRTPDGEYSEHLQVAVTRLQTRFFSGARARDDYDGKVGHTTPTGRFDRRTAVLLKQVVQALG